MATENFDRYLAGEQLYGDNLSLADIEKWFDDEKEGYANLYAQDGANCRYPYHALNELYGLRHFGERSFPNALGLGSAFGDEFLPIARRIGKLTILDPSDAYANATHVEEIPCEYRKPDLSGTLPFPDQQFDLILCLGVLHHIPNVSHVMNECFRCLAPGGIMLVREPIISMGDWRQPRAGLTKRERGIPLHIFESIIQKTGFTVRYRTVCNFQALAKIAVKCGVLPYNHPLLTRLDVFLSRLFFFNRRYHASGFFQKLRPAAVQWVLERSSR